MDHANRDQTVGVGVGKAAKEDAIDNAEHCGRRTNAQHQRYENRDRKDGVTAEAAEGVADILKNGFNIEAWPLLVRFFLGALDSPKRDDRLPPRLLRCHSGSNICFRLLFEVELRLLVYFMMRLGS